MASLLEKSRIILLQHTETMMEWSGSRASSGQLKILCPHGRWSCEPQARISRNRFQVSAYWLSYFLISHLISFSYHSHWWSWTPIALRKMKCSMVFILCQFTSINNYLGVRNIPSSSHQLPWHHGSWLWCIGTETNLRISLQQLMSTGNTWGGKKRRKCWVKSLLMKIVRRWTIVWSQEPA